MDSVMIDIDTSKATKEQRQQIAVILHLLNPKSIYRWAGGSEEVGDTYRFVVVLDSDEDLNDFAENVVSIVPNIVRERGSYDGDENWYVKGDGS